jgi:peptide/nickel transport system substrate-binding protein
MRSHPIGTGPFKFVEFKPNEVIKVTRNPQYWKPDRPYLDGIEYAIIKNPSTRTLALVSGQIDMIQPYAVTPPLMKDIKAQAPQVICETVPQNISNDLLINSARAPFDDRELRRAMALSLDRKAFIDILAVHTVLVGFGVSSNTVPPPWTPPEEFVP